LSQNQPAYTDVWGRPDRTENWVLRAFENFLSPGYIGNRSASGAENALRELYNATGDSAVLPSKPQKSYTVDGEKRNLTADQWLRLSNAKGQTALAAVENLTQSNAYQSMSDTEKVNAVKAVYDYASAVAANQVYGKELEGTIKSVKESGIDPGLYYAYKEMEDALNESVEGYEARDQVFQTIRGDASLSEEQKNQLYHTLMIKGTSDSQWEKYQEISDVVTAEEYVDAMIQSQAIKAYGDTLEQGRATAEATEFSYYLDSMGYDKAKRDALSETFKFYNMFPAEPSNYTFEMMQENGSQNEKENAGAIEASGVSAAQYMTIKSLASAATYEKGKSGAKLAAYGKVVSENTENYDQYAAIMHAMGYKNIDEAYTGAGALPDVAQAGSQVSRNASGSASGFVNPTRADNSVITSRYGRRNAPSTNQGYGSSNHGGIDIGGSGGNLNGQEADTVGAGTVTTVGYDPSGYGNYVIIDHGNGYRTLYGHLQKATVRQGQKVDAGQQIGVIGNTGNSQAPHLHLSAWYKDQEIDPATMIPGY
ncbi:MAG: M23 family metallopeptidase, partial [Clostridiaceae bacterium]|nr:M23 family metallopeptidase [Clostridiaceae bacterium]